MNSKTIEAKLRALLEDLKQKYPIKGIKDGHPQLIFGGWAIAVSYTHLTLPTTPYV